MFTYQIFTKHPLCARHCAGVWGYKDEKILAPVLKQFTVRHCDSCLRGENVREKKAIPTSRAQRGQYSTSLMKESSEALVNQLGVYRVLADHVLNEPIRQGLCSLAPYKIPGETRLKYRRRDKARKNSLLVNVKGFYTEHRSLEAGVISQASWKSYIGTTSLESRSPWEGGGRGGEHFTWGEWVGEPELGTDSGEPGTMTGPLS